MDKFYAFTHKSDGRGILRELKTICGVGTPFNKAIGEKQTKVHQYVGLWDTGATSSVISNNIVEFLNLEPISKARVHDASGEKESNVYAIHLLLPNNIGVSFLPVTVGVLNGFDILIGMDVISQGDFAITNVEGETTFSFRIPSIKTIDYVKEQQDFLITNHSKNSKCYCGSGKSFKNCHMNKKA